MSNSALVAQQQADLEAAQPLLAKGDKSIRYSELFETTDESMDPAIEDPMTYKLAWLKGWGVFAIIKQTVWDNPSLWKIMMRLLLVGLICCVGAYNLIPDASLIHVEKFDEMNTVLSAFVTLMLSFFLSSAISRWINCIDGLFSLINSIKNYSMQLHAYGVDMDKIHLAMRYCVVSSHFLIHELRCLKIVEERKKLATELLWEKLLSGESEYATVDAGEREVLELVEEKSAQMWIWVAAHLGSLANDGDVPPMSSPAYGNLMNLIQAAQEGQRQTRIAIVVQMPMVYLHTLAYLVHVNSLLFAIITGIAVGTTMKGIQDTYTKWDLAAHSVNTKTAVVTVSAAEHIQMLMIEGVKGFLAPLLIQAFLQIGLSIVTPFHDDDAAIPVGKLLESIETELKDAKIMRSKPQKFDMTPFKKQTK